MNSDTSDRPCHWPPFPSVVLPLVGPGCETNPRPNLKCRRVILKQRGRGRTTLPANLNVQPLSFLMLDSRGLRCQAQSSNSHSFHKPNFVDRHLFKTRGSLPKPISGFPWVEEINDRHCPDAPMNIVGTTPDSDSPLWRQLEFNSHNPEFELADFYQTIRIPARLYNGGIDFGLHSNPRNVVYPWN